jgi:hypothetical protein
VTFHTPVDCTKASSVCAPTVSTIGVPSTTALNVCPSILTVMRVPGAAFVVPEIVAVGSLVRTVGAPLIVISGGTVSIVSCCVAVPMFPAPSVVEAETV